jgi:TonB-linked SusC/RagA family outer membrane protein
MKRIVIVIFTLLLFISDMFAQNKILTGKITEKTTKYEMMGVSVSEIDANNRLVGGTVTNMDGEFALTIKNEKNKLRINFMGFKTIVTTIDLGKRLVIAMEEDNVMLKEATVVAKATQNTGISSVPKRELSLAISHLDFGEEIEGLSTTSPEDVLQGRISGLDIVSTSGAPGSGSQMRIRGTKTLSGNANPLIVLNDIIFNGDIDSNFDFSSATDQQFADMLCVNVDDIASIDVLKDAASCAIYGSKGANGVIKINTRRGAKGKPIIKYSYKLTEMFQPNGMSMLNGDDYTMLMKQAYFNRTLGSNETYAQYERKEYSYDPLWSEYENFNNNTDWVSAVTQHGWTNDHYINISGGGERATFSLSGGYVNQSGTNIGQVYNKITNRSQLEYRISDRILCTAEFQYTYTDNKKNYSDLLEIAYEKMPNLCIYNQDQNGNDTNLYYNIRSDSELNSAQKNLFNPVALAYLAKNEEKGYRILPTVRLQYYLLDPSEHYLKYSAYVSFDMNNVKTGKFLPAEVSNYNWDNSSVNLATDITSEKLTVQTENKVEYQSRFSDKHSLIASLTMQTSSSSSHYQYIESYGHPDNSLIDATSTGYLSYLYNSTSSNRSLGLIGYFHYCMMGRYILSGGLRVDGSTKFGKEQRWGAFPSISGKWIISDEPFMKEFSDVVTLFAIRPGWGITGNQPTSNYSQYSTYSADTYGYLGKSAVRPTQIQLTNLRWEKTAGYNLGMDLELWDGALTSKVDLYNNLTSDMLWPSYKISPTSGFTSLSYKNIGSMNNKGWEMEFSANRLLKAGKFSMDFNVNFGNNRNTIIDIDESIMNQYNDAANTIGNGVYLTRIQPDNSNGSIYGFRYKGVYSYSYDKYDKAAETGKTCPIAYDAEGNVLTDYQGNPKQMYYRYKNTKYAFKGGDAIYEDINYDGSIDEYDIVYLGNSNPKLEGGLGFTARYGNLSLVVFNNFRYGNKIINIARMNAENMYTDKNQCTSVNWRWRKEGDVTVVPRAVYQQGYNWLGSDRYVEDGSFLRVKYITLRYSLPNDIIKHFGIKSVSTYLTMNNLYCFTKYSGTDPEVSVSGLTGVASDNSRTPRSKDWTVGISVIF